MGAPAKHTLKSTMELAHPPPEQADLSRLNLPVVF